jgi:beta-galactosidase
MRSVLATSVIGLAITLAAAGAGERPSFAYINLQPKANQKLDEGFHGADGNDLAELPRGEQTLAKVKFKIGDALIQFGSTTLKDKPARVEGIAVDRKLVRLHFLHATGFGGSPPDDPNHVKDDTLIGAYVVNYDDKTTARIRIVYGKDVRDWWDWDRSKETTRAKLAWEGSNEYAKKFKVRLLLYRGTWDNPHPDKRVVSIDYTSTNDNPAAPFCIAITAEIKDGGAK